MCLFFITKYAFFSYIYMRVISTSGTRTSKFILRTEQTVTTSYKVTLTNGDTRSETEIDVTDWTMTQFNDNIGQLIVTFTDTYNEGDEYAIKITSVDGNTVYHRNKLFITDKVLQNYSING